MPLQNLLLSVSPTWMPISFPSCLFPNSEGLKGAPLLLPGEWVCLKVLFSSELLNQPLFCPLVCCPLLLPFWNCQALLYSSTAPPRVWSGYRWPEEGVMTDAQPCKPTALQTEEERKELLSWGRVLGCSTPLLLSFSKPHPGT